MKKIEKLVVETVNDQMAYYWILGGEGKASNAINSAVQLMKTKERTNVELFVNYQLLLKTK